ncbi:hypothetical protein A3C23_02565 [Candidatus Roizmanbacteria bacterium RIFCSPHIGHO2_02_FULL_37_13b]|uniref:LysM domain-containing protein n=1 Tax=Candidatus Roizmanbacteria bacterium RIFCSPLOWO2_02_FULL_36_11 TaxID=1802071 RepID=A0A1F7JG12_9BACT|nr:MAG: hypothetical protein A3C23_02565 [Candidatus Roizmanbacteria bacterium RIFCSPHIGHO2_02_FULL_37_13b]OGK54558.1 MAG: hypothetical protein A3H78_01575 [Candidatus Roizmanbacteria bacterium RIFCSPLOWO2_02_FULL_36_11]
MSKSDESYVNILMDKFKGNYQSVILGILVIIVGFAVLFKTSKNGMLNKVLTTKDQAAAATQQQSNLAPGGKYTVKKGETLWAICEKYYGSGYAWTDVTTTNKLKNANLIEVGQVLTMPELKNIIKPAELTTQPAKKQVVKELKPITIKETNYKVIKGDNLWKISVGAYGDGYQWVTIARTNGLKNPNLIYPGNLLKLPR